MVEEGYGYNGHLDKLLRDEFSRIHSGRDESERVVYLDHAGATLYARSQVERSSDLLLGGVFGNPHSHSHSSHAATEAVRTTRHTVLSFFNASHTHYSVVFTSGDPLSLVLSGSLSLSLSLSLTLSLSLSLSD